MRAVLQAFFGALFSGVLDLWKNFQASRAQKKLGALEAEKATNKAKRDAQKRAAKIYAKPDPDHIDDTLDKL